MAESTPRASSHHGIAIGSLIVAMRRPLSRLCIIPEDRAVHHSSTKPYERDQEVYAMILDKNLARLGIRTPTRDDIYDSPVWTDGDPIYHPLRWSCNVPFTPADACRFADKEEFAYHHYLEQLKSKYYVDRHWFRSVVKSYWGLSADCTFEVTMANRPYIRVELAASFKSIKKKKYYIGYVERFAYIMARLCPIQGLGPLTDIFGFRFVDKTGQRVFEFERMDRVRMRYPVEISKMVLVVSDDKEMKKQQKQQEKRKKMVICYDVAPTKNKVIEIE
ncbi:hypothetical protein F5Y06DRAFT_306574 [Hypoxylon sp. FL0890]|nr:hypothetical protein F5Y06DRAFT_306574 [Hypoxylon sp. FL0890]